MKSDREITEKVRAAIEDCTRGIDAAPSLQYRIARQTKGEKPAMKKISVSVIVVALLTLTICAALAAGLGLFGRLAQDERCADGRLSGLEEASDTVSVSLVTEDGITIEIGQGYYEGSRVFISYRLSGNLYAAEMHEGAPENEPKWTTVIENCVCAEHFVNDIPTLQQLNAYLDGNGQRWGTSYEAALHDGLYLEDGAYLQIIGGDNAIQEDGSVIGWKECEIPEDRIADTLTFKAVLFRGKHLMFQDGSTYKDCYERGESTDIFFTLRHNDRLTFLQGDARTEACQAHAEFAAGRIDTRGSVRLSCPAEWVRIWETWENEENTDLIVEWSVYQNGQPFGSNGTEGISIADEHTLVFSILFDRADSLENLTLVPVYLQSGEHPDEAIRLEKIIKDE